MTKTGLWVVALLLGTLTMLGCKDKGGDGTGGSNAGPGSVEPEDTGPIIIGAYLSMTGSMATFGITTERGAQMAVDELNAKGGVLGRKLELVTLDDQGKADEAGNTVTRLIDVNKAVAIIGEVASTLSLVGG